MEINLTPEQIATLALAAYLLGGIARVLGPYGLEKLQNGTKFDWRFAVGQTLVTAGGFIVLLANPGAVQSIGALGILGGLVGGFGAASLGRNAQKTVDVARGK
jgi:hypothetical protein